MNAKLSGCSFRSGMVIAVAHLCLGMALCWLWMPGAITWDSIADISSGQRGVLSDWHSPLVSIVWTFLFEAGGDSPHFILWGQVLMLLTVCFLLGKLCFKSAFARLALTVVSLFLPPLFLLTGVFNRDLLLALLLGLSIVAPVYVISVFQKKWWGLILAFLLLSMSYLVRQEGVIVGIPIVFFYAKRLLLSRKLAADCCKFAAMIRLSIWTAVISTLLFGAGKIFNYLVDTRDACPEAHVAISDLYLLSVARGDVSLFPAVQNTRAYQEHSCEKVLQIENLLELKRKGRTYQPELFQCGDTSNCSRTISKWLSAMLLYPREIIQIKLWRAALYLGDWHFGPIAEDPGRLQARYEGYLYEKDGGPKIRIPGIDTTKDSGRTAYFKRFELVHRSLISELEQFYKSDLLFFMRSGYSILIVHALALLIFVCYSRKYDWRIGAGCAFSCSGLFHFVFLIFFAPNILGRYCLWFSLSGVSALAFGISVLCCRLKASADQFETICQHSR